MQTINHTLEKRVLQADGKYLDNQGLETLERYHKTYETRLETYQHLSQHSNNLVLMVLQRMGQDYPELIQKHGKRCQFDMTCVLRYVALAILKDDETFFMDEMMDWLDTILVAYRRNEHCATAYRHMLEAMEDQLPAASSAMIRPYLDEVILKLQSHTAHN
ncbi:MAG: hypothetical protein VKK04_15195 [Synechococcales bacterium]|nr:hypothetical protein [Synechococcales bacterium]